MKDIFGHTLEMDDTVAFYAPGYRDMITAKIIKFTPKQVRVEFTSQGYVRTYLNYPSNFAKKV
ncbi:MAG: hypothetical protein COA84_13970 [Robiginitomaculum sp.]|nr:MAG: hypothetical protein COA84_13970 [Robiginitomaculum sp.]